MESSYALISCTKSKHSVRCAASDMYSASPLFRKAYEYCTARGLNVLILSAKYGLIHADTPVEPYDLTLNGQPRSAVRRWAEGVTESIRGRLAAGTAIELHAGRNYTRFLNLSGYSVSSPVEGLSIGRRLQWYSQHIDLTLVSSKWSGIHMDPDQARKVLRSAAYSLIGQTIPTLSRGKPNTILSVDEKGVAVRANQVRVVPWAIIDGALDLLLIQGGVSGDDLRTKKLPAQYRSAFVLSLLSRLPFARPDPDGSASVLLK